MAKLENVKILDMVNGEPTRVEYNGAIYEKTEDDAEAGDLVRVIDADVIEDVTQGGFYETYIDDDIDGPAFVDDDDDVRSYEANDHALETFRKVSADLVERLAELERRLEALEERTGAKEGERQARRLTVGDYARVVANDTMHSANIGDIVKIVEDDYDDHPYRCEDLNGEDVGWFKEHELELVTDEESRWAKIGRKPGEFKKGDIVRVTDSCGGRVKTGTITEVVYIDSDGDFTVRDEDGDDWYVEAELIVPVEQRFDLAVEPKVGARQ